MYPLLLIMRGHCEDGLARDKLSSYNFLYMWTNMAAGRDTAVITRQIMLASHRSGFLGLRHENQRVTTSFD